MQFKRNYKTLLLSLLSIFIVIYAEWVYPAKAFGQCKWPLDANAKHIAIIADPQIIDDYSYPGRNGFLKLVTRVVTDRYVARNFRLLHRRLRPDMIVFLGDLMDGGREIENDEAWKLEYQRYRRIFPLTPSVVQIESVPGNHDVGCANSIIPHAYERFEEHFGKGNKIHPYAGFNLVTLDSNALMNTADPSVQKPARELLNYLTENRKDFDPTIILSHIPLYRPEGSTCGARRESSRTLSRTQGYQYITEIDQALSNEILENIQPKYIFSGDDHDSCVFTHRWGAEGTSEEHTVKSFSMAMSVKKPGFDILSLDSSSLEYQSRSCLVADPFVPFIIQGIAYPVLLLLSVLPTYNALKSKSRLNPLPLSIKDKPVMNYSRQRPCLFIAHEALTSAAVLACSWFIGQMLINSWTYAGI